MRRHIFIMPNNRTTPLLRITMTPLGSITIHKINTIRDRQTPPAQTAAAPIALLINELKSSHLSPPNTRINTINPKKVNLVATRHSQPNPKPTSNTKSTRLNRRQRRRQTIPNLTQNSHNSRQWPIAISRLISLNKRPTAKTTSTIVEQLIIKVHMVQSDPP